MGSRNSYFAEVCQPVREAPKGYYRAAWVNSPRTHKYPDAGWPASEASHPRYYSPDVSLVAANQTPPGPAIVAQWYYKGAKKAA